MCPLLPPLLPPLPPPLPTVCLCVCVQTFLAGKSVFKADVVEIWALGEPAEGEEEGSQGGSPSDGRTAYTGFSDIPAATY